MSATVPGMRSVCFAADRVVLLFVCEVVIHTHSTNLNGLFMIPGTRV